MKYYVRLILITLFGVAFMSLLAVSVYWLRDLLESNGHHISDRTFLVILAAVLGGGFGLASKFVLRTTNRDRSSHSQA
jgi:hypothetical protein